jgi:hypothetical protein
VALSAAGFIQNSIVVELLPIAVVAYRIEEDPLNEILPGVVATA